MTEAHQALQGFWAQFGVPAYLRDGVPDDARLPYITYEAADAPGGRGLITAHNWHRREGDWNAQRAALLDRIARAVPPGGARLDLPTGGFLMLYRPKSGFQQYFADPQDRRVLAGRTCLEAVYYHA